MRGKISEQESLGIKNVEESLWCVSSLLLISLIEVGVVIIVLF